jgi:quercetin dioxygenase-like cupin family protein
MGTFSIVNLRELENAAERFGFGAYQESRFANEPLACRQTGLSYHRIKPGQRSPIAHRHKRQEELYVIVAGSGRAKLDVEIREFGPWDAFRVDADVVRSFEAGPDGAEILAFGAPVVDGDERDPGELVSDHWDDGSS